MEPSSFAQKLGCPHCLTRKRSNGKVELYHSMLAATVVAPGHAKIVPLMPEFIAPQDGAEKQDCERNAVKRWFGRASRTAERLSKPRTVAARLSRRRSLCLPAHRYDGEGQWRRYTACNETAVGIGHHREHGDYNQCRDRRAGRSVGARLGHCAFLLVHQSLS